MATCAGATDLAPRWRLFALALLLSVTGQSARPLNLLLRGDLQAFVQGVEFAGSPPAGADTALATATAVTLAGAVGFVGFVAPHLMRQADRRR